MAESYYTDEMREFVSNLPNTLDFHVDIGIMEDQDGEYLCLVFSDADYLKYQDETDEFWAIANYLVDLRNGLIALGARATFVILSNEDEAVVITGEEDA